MEKRQVNIDFTSVGKSVEKFVRERAIKAGSNIIYKQDEKVVSEDPRTGNITVLEVYPPKHR
ncbi:hypothetical protein [Sediminibacterium sp.]|jgi:hypothetical protein|uniref:hypothetical protein n=1 Tax=Sediminibacterium sp. TaxID=1917865 RepID=UPI002600F2C4|nr:hypothetical protein [Sediminibacterium sp.]MBT9485651.1 hypothetical protein [Sediminibacterium sp.]